MAGSAAPPPNSIHPLTRAEWRAWLEENHSRGEGVWLITYKKATGKARVEYEETVEEALCFGWIDSTPNKLDDERSLLWFAPRKPGTGWSKPNVDRQRQTSRDASAPRCGDGRAGGREPSRQPVATVKGRRPVKKPTVQVP
jgi:hypothetical protein